MKDEAVKMLIIVFCGSLPVLRSVLQSIRYAARLWPDESGKKREAEKVQRFVVSANVSKGEADKHGIEYAFGKAECDERDRINEAIDSQSHRGLYTCELDFPISERSLEWLKYSGFEVSQADGKTQVSWENAKC